MNSKEYIFISKEELSKTKCWFKHKSIYYGDFILYPVLVFEYLEKHYKLWKLV